VAEFNLQVQKRTVKGKKVSTLRNAGYVPASIYGPLIDPVKIQVDYRELELTLRDAGGTNVIDIAVEDGETYPVLAREVQRDIIRGDILHVDFFSPDMNKKIRANVRLVIEGQSPLVASRKGIMITGPNSITVEMLPSNLINEVSVDVSQLTEMGATIEVKDLPISEGITVINDPDEMIARIVQPSAARAAEMKSLLEGATATEGEEGELEGEGEEGELEGEGEE
jgi:large subunit ribosomal protein L25